MDYESVKESIGKIIAGKPFLTKVFFFLLGRLFLRARYVKRALRELIPSLPGERPLALDAGFGYGPYSYYIAKKYPRISVTSVEIIEKHLRDFSRFARDAGLKNIETVKLDLREMDYKSRFDLALSVDVMEHIEQDLTVLENIHRSLKEGGVLLLHTPHLSMANRRNGGSLHEDHVRDGYSTDEIMGKLKIAGFNRIEYELSYGKYGSTAWILLQKIPLAALGKSKLFYLLLPLYFAVIYPVAEFLMWFDTRKHNREGGGILVKAWK